MDILNEDWSPYISIINVIEYVKDYLINPGMYLANYEATLLYFGVKYCLYIFIITIGTMKLQKNGLRSMLILLFKE